MRKEHALQGERIGVSAQAAAAIAEMAADVEAGPIVDGLRYWRFHQQIRRERLSFIVAPKRTISLHSHCYISTTVIPGQARRSSLRPKRSVRG